MLSGRHKYALKDLGVYVSTTEGWLIPSKHVKAMMKCTKGY